jgi:hypothetical protein
VLPNINAGVVSVPGQLSEPTSFNGFKRSLGFADYSKICWARFTFRPRRPYCTRVSSLTPFFAEMGPIVKKSLHYVTQLGGKCSADEEEVETECGSG